MISAFDFIVVLIAIIFLSPLFLILCLILKFSGEGEIFYLQERVGRNNKKFKVYKFATMLKNSEFIGAGTLTLKNDPRVLRIGKYLRITKLNELPQLFNILFGEMSLVGPRPLVPEGENLYSEELSHSIRSIRPGVTGIGSLVLRDEESYYAPRENAHEFYRDVISPYKGSLELWYVKNQSFSLNIKIIFLTFFAIFFPSFDPIKYFAGLPKMPEKMKST